MKSFQIFETNIHNLHIFIHEFHYLFGGYVLYSNFCRQNNILMEEIETGRYINPYTDYGFN
mgnify:CR=1 FL=1